MFVPDSCMGPQGSSLQDCALLPLETDDGDGVTHS